MKQRYITAVLVDTENAKDVAIIRIPNSLKSLYRHLNCNTIDIVTRYFHGKPYAIVCDDNGLLNADKRHQHAIYTTDERGNLVEILVGNCLIANEDDDGNLASLTAEDINGIFRCRFDMRGIGQIGLLAVL